MNQIAILPAGCLVSSKDILFSNDQHIIYSSNLAVYILNAQSFIIEKIIAVTERTVASIAVSPHNHNLLIATGCDGCLSFWKLSEEELICRVSVQANTGFLLAWDPFSPDHCAVLMNQPIMRLLYWDMRKAGSGLSELFVIKNQTVQVSVIRWNLLTPGLLAAGCNNGWVILFQITTKSQKTLSIPERSVAVTDVQWDRLSAVYLLVAYQTFISLWDTESLTEIHTFDKQGGNISAIAWMDWTAGNFVSSNSKNGYLRVWNASQRQPLESVRVAIGGLVTVYFGTGTKRAICACLDGSVVVFHMVKLQMEYCTAAGHTETIFDCSFSPASPDLLATASYDGTVKLWNVPGLSLTRTLLNSGEKCIVYACDWSPKGNMVVACDSLGSVIIWDMQSGNELTRYAHHTKAVYCVAWNKFDESLIASTSGDCTLVVIAAAVESRKDGSAVPTSSTSSSQPSRMKVGLASQSATSRRRSQSGQEGAVAASDIQLRFVHPAPVFGCAWSKHSSILLVTCCQDGNVRVFDCALHGKALVRQVLVGHTARAFVAAWSPLLPGTIASGSDDQTILIWKIDMDTDLATSDAKPGLPVTALKMLRGHTSNIRALLWSSEVKGLLLSGSWDSTIRLWDATTGKCLHMVTGKRKNERECMPADHGDSVFFCAVVESACNPLSLHRSVQTTPQTCTPSLPTRIDPSPSCPALETPQVRVALFPSLLFYTDRLTSYFPISIFASPCNSTHLSCGPHNLSNAFHAPHLFVSPLAFSAAVGAVRHP
jgi:WD40 repeat protein